MFVFLLFAFGVNFGSLAVYVVFLEFICGSSCIVIVNIACVFVSS